MFNIPDGLDSELKRVLRDIQAELYRIRKGSGTPQVYGGTSNTFYPMSTNKNELRETTGDYTIHGNLFVDGGINGGESAVDRLTTTDASPSTLVLTDDNTNQILTGSLGDMKFRQPGGDYHFEAAVGVQADMHGNFILEPTVSDVTATRVIGTVYQNTGTTMKVIQISVILS